MELSLAIQNRRSVRAFRTEPIAPDQLKALVLEAAIWAPSGGNAQTWHFGLITRPDLIGKIKMISPGMLGQPAAVIAICQDMGEVRRKGSDLAVNALSWMDTAMAAQNLMLAAHAAGIGTCAIASFHAKAVQKILGLPEGIVPQLLVSLGYPSQSPKPPSRRTEVLWLNEYTESGS